MLTGRLLRIARRLSSTVEALLFIIGLADDVALLAPHLVPLWHLVLVSVQTR